MVGVLQSRWYRIGLPLVISGLILSCSPLNPLGWASPEQTKIGGLGQLKNQSVVEIEGIVVNVAPFLDGGAYQIQDETGKVWVKSDRPLPTKGKTVKVRGELSYQAIFIGQEKLGESYLLELNQDLTATNLVPQPLASNVPVPDSPVTSQASPSPQISPSPQTSQASPVPTLSPSSQVSPSPQTTPSPSPTSVSIPVSPPKDTQPSPQPKSSPTAKASPSPKPTSKTQPSSKFNPDDFLLPHKRLLKSSTPGSRPSHSVPGESVSVAVER